MKKMAFDAALAFVLLTETGVTLRICVSAV